MKSIVRKLIVGLVLAAVSCNPSDFNTRPQVVLEESYDADGTRKIMRKVNGLLEGRTIVYQRNGVIGAIFYFQRDTLEGPQYSFYSTGNPKTWENAHQGKLNGKSYGFFPNGQPAFIRHMVDGKRSGRYLLFYEMPSNHLRRLIDFVVVNGREKQNGFIEYGKLGQLKRRWGFPIVRSVRDTIPLGDSFILTLNIKYPKNKNLLVVTGDFDSNFHLQDSTAQQVFYGDNNGVKIFAQAKQRGKHIIRGYISDYQPQSARAHSMTAIQERRVHFAYRYYVK